MKADVSKIEHYGCDLVIGQVLYYERMNSINEAVVLGIDVSTNGRDGLYLTLEYRGGVEKFYQNRTDVFGKDSFCLFQVTGEKDTTDETVRLYRDKAEIARELMGKLSRTVEIYNRKISELREIFGGDGDGEDGVAFR